MAVLQMQRINICALKKDRKQILETLQRRGVVEINDLLKEDSVFKKTDLSSSQTIFEKNATLTQEALNTLEQYAPRKESMFAKLNGKREISVNNYYTFSDEKEELVRVAHRINSLSREIAENKAEILKLQARNESLTPWLNLDIPMTFKGTKYTSAFIGTLESKKTLEDIYLLLAENAPDLESIYAEIISSSSEQTCIFLICRKSEYNKLDEALRKIGFARPSSPSKKAPSQLKTAVEEKINILKREIEKAQEEIKSYSGERNGFRFIIDYYNMRSEKYGVISRLLQSNRTFILSGYIPKRDVQKLQDELNYKFDIAIECEDPSPNEDVPILLSNNGFASPVEGVLESFSLPGRGEVDPTNVMSFCYYFLFGLMLSDAAYGFIMTLICGIILAKYKKIEDSMRKAIKMFFFCGISTMFWGVLFGSYFGDAVDVISSTFFGTKLTIPPLWFEPIKDPMRMLMFSLTVGVIHLFTGLAMQFYQLWKAKKYKDAIYDVVFWYVFLTSLIVQLLSMEMFVNIAGLKFTLSAKTGSIAGTVALISAVAITLTAGRESRNPFKRLLKGLYGLYGVTGYLSDVLSYSRLLALGLATGVIASVINKMGSMAGGGVVGFIVFVIIFVIGHTINIGINALGAYVHTNRLQFVEFFGKFYEGGGRKFTPFAPNTKYFNIREEINNG